MDKTIQKTIYKNLFGKTELKSNRVELKSAADELQEYAYELDASTDELRQYATDARDAVAKGYTLLERLNSVYNVADIRMKDIMEMANQLGVDIPEIEELKSSMSAFEKYRDSFTGTFK
jgi:conjugal transfer/entry exclusion protein